MFKDTFKYYKRKCPSPDLSTLISPSNAHGLGFQRTAFQTNESFEEILKTLGLISSAKWNIIELKQHPGLIIVENPFTQGGSYYWIKKCLSEYTSPPHKCNLHSLGLLAPHHHWWQLAHTDEGARRDLLRKLRWVTLGYHHDWDTKEYREESKSCFPRELAELVKSVCAVVGGWEMTPQAAILNFYRMDSTLSPHTDHSELHLDAPLVSISFGQSAVFLIGGPTLDHPVSPILIKSGDILIMSGESRLSYHAVPRIIAAEDWSDSDDDFQSYLKEARINLNVRQVLFPNQHNLPSVDRSPH